MYVHNLHWCSSVLECHTIATNDFYYLVVFWKQRADAKIMHACTSCLSIVDYSCVYRLLKGKRRKVSFYCRRERHIVFTKNGGTRTKRYQSTTTVILLQVEKSDCTSFIMVVERI
jgi:hypothetical protein